MSTINTLSFISNEELTGRTILKKNEENEIIRAVWKGLDVVCKRNKKNQEHIDFMKEHASFFQSNDNVVKIYGFNEQEVIYEYIETNLEMAFPLISKWSLGDRLHFCRKIATSIHFLHKNNFIHSAIRPTNILIKDGEPKLAGFTNVMSMKNIKPGTQWFRSPVIYIPPEVIDPGFILGVEKDEEFIISKKADVFCFSILLWQVLFNGKFPYPTEFDFKKLLHRILVYGLRPENIPFCNKSDPFLSSVQIFTEKFLKEHLDFCSRSPEEHMKWFKNQLEIVKETYPCTVDERELEFNTRFTDTSDDLDITKNEELYQVLLNGAKKLNPLSLSDIYKYEKIHLPQLPSIIYQIMEKGWHANPYVRCPISYFVFYLYIFENPVFLVGCI